MAINISLDQVTCENEARGLNCLKIQAFSRCNEGTFDDRPVKNSIPDGCIVIETISVFKIPQVQGSMLLAGKVAEDQIAYENEARGLKSLKILGFSRCNEGTIGDGAVNNRKPTGCYVKATISVLKFPQVQGSLQIARKVALDQIAYEIEARGLKSLKILGFSRCNDGTIGYGAVNNPKPTGFYVENLKILGFSRCNEGTIRDGAVNNPNPTGYNVKETISILKFPQVQGSLQLERKVALDQVAYESEAIC